MKPWARLFCRLFATAACPNAHGGLAACLPPGRAGADVLSLGCMLGCALGCASVPMFFVDGFVDSPTPLTLK